MKEPIEVRWRFVIDPVADPLLHEWYEQLPPGRRRGRILSKLLSQAVAMERALAEGRSDSTLAWGNISPLGFPQHQRSKQESPDVSEGVPMNQDTATPSEVHAEIPDHVWANGLGDMLSAFEQNQ